MSRPQEQRRRAGVQHQQAGCATKCLDAPVSGASASLSDEGMAPSLCAAEVLPFIT